jgi:hypothetical protein
MKEFLGILFLAFVLGLVLFLFGITEWKDLLLYSMLFVMGHYGSKWFENRKKRHESHGDDSL